MPLSPTRGKAVAWAYCASRIPAGGAAWPQPSKAGRLHVGDFAAPSLPPCDDHHSIWPLPQLPATETWGRFLEKKPKLHPESLTDVPQRDDGRIALAQFETANIGSVHPHALGKLGL
jgi:hypothetical protein